MIEETCQPARAKLRAGFRNSLSGRFPGGALRAVLERDAGGQQFGADAVGLGKVLGLLGGGAGLDARLNGRFIQRAARLQKGLRIALQQAQQAAQDCMCSFL